MAKQARASITQDAVSNTSQAHSFEQVLDTLQLDDLNAEALGNLESLVAVDVQARLKVLLGDNAKNASSPLDEAPIVLVDAQTLTTKESDGSSGWVHAESSAPGPRAAEVEALLEGEKRKYAAALTEGLTLRYQPEGEGTLRARYFRQSHELELTGSGDTAQRMYHHEMAHHLQHVDPRAATALRKAVAASRFPHLRRGKYPGRSLQPHLDEMVCDAIADYQTNPNVFRGYFPKLASVIAERVLCKKR